MDRERLKQPVTAIRACAQFALLKLERNTSDESADIRPYLATIVAETRRLEMLFEAPAEAPAADILLSVRPVLSERTPWAKRGGSVAQSDRRPLDDMRLERHDRPIAGGLAPQVAQQLRLASRRLARGGHSARGPKKLVEHTTR